MIERKDIMQSEAEIWMITACLRMLSEKREVFEYERCNGRKN